MQEKTDPNVYVLCDYGATGEGQTYMVLFTFALNKAKALQKFSKEFNPYYAQGATVYDGYYFDFEGAPFLITDALRKAMEEWPECYICLLYTSPSPRDGLLSRMPSSA